LLTRFGTKTWFRDGSFVDDKYIVAIESTSIGARIWKLPYKDVLSQYGYFHIAEEELKSESALQAEDEKSNGVRKTIDLSGIDFKQAKGAAGSNASSTQGMMTATDIQNLISGNTESGISKKGSKYLIYYNPNGTMLGRATSKTNTEYKDSGVWEIWDSDQLCITWKKWLNHKQHCYLLDALGGGQYRSTGVGNSYEGINVFRKGDPEGLSGESATQYKTLAGFDYTGTYTSAITGDEKRRLVGSSVDVSLTQSGQTVSGTIGDSQGKIWGDVVGNALKFEWSAQGRYMGSGEWIVGSDSSELQDT
jgi:hypothetical protein